MTDSWATSTPSTPGVHNEPPRSVQWENLSQDQLNVLRDKLVQSLEQVITQDLTGGVSTSTPPSEQLTNWADSLPVLGPLITAITSGFVAPTGGYPDLSTYFNDWIANLFGGGSNPTSDPVQAAALPNIPAGTGPGQSSDLLTHLEAVISGAGSTGATPVDAASQGMQLITSTLASVAALLQSRVTEQSGATNSGQSFLVFFPSYSTWADVPVNTTYGNIPGASSHGTGTFVINSSHDAAWNPVNDGDVAAIAIFNNGGTGQAHTDTVYQRINASLAGLPNGGNAKNYAVARANAITNPSDYVYGLVYLNTSFQLVWEIGCYIGGTRHVWDTGTTTVINLSFSFIAGVGNNPDHYQGYCGNMLVFDHINTSGDPGGLFPADLSHLYWGFRSDTAGAGATSPAPAAFVGCSDNSPPTVPGVGIRLYRTNTAAVNGTINMDTVNFFNDTFFDAVVEDCSTIRQYLGTIGAVDGSVEPTIQVDQAGRYLVSARVDISAATCSYGAVSICPVVIRYNSAGAQQEVRNFPSPGFFVNGFGGQYNTGFIGGSEVIACQPGDFLVLMYYLDSGPNSLGAMGAPLSFVGEASGGHTYFEVTLANWSSQ